MAAPITRLAEIAKLKRAIRDTRYQGERFADQAKLDPDDVDEKRRLLESIPPRGERANWQREIDEVNQRLHAQLAPIRAELGSQLERLRKELSTAELLSSREHPFCLFPIDYLTETYRSLLA